MFNPSIGNLFFAIGKTKRFQKFVSIFLIAMQYFALCCGSTFFWSITIFLFLCEIVILALDSETETFVDNFWIFFVFGPGLVAFLIVAIVEIVNILRKIIRGKEK
jgi:hypothetical protein